MNAIALLKSQHRKVEALFSKIEGAKDSRTKQKLFGELADNLAGHATIEEHHFYPAVRAKRTEDILLESLEEHLGIKRVLADLLKLDAKDETYDAELTVLKEQVEHHVGEEEKGSVPEGQEAAGRGPARSARRGDAGRIRRARVRPSARRRAIRDRARRPTLNCSPSNLF